MTYVGARGETERQMVEALLLTLAQEQMHAALNGPDQGLGVVVLTNGEGGGAVADEAAQRALSGAAR